MTWDTGGFWEKVRNVRTQHANTPTLAAHAAPAALQGREDKSQTFPDSLNYFWSDQTQLTGWIAQLGMDIRHKPGSFPKEQSKMRSVFNHQRGIASG